MAVEPLGPRMLGPPRMISWEIPHGFDGTVKVWLQEGQTEAESVQLEVSVRKSERSVLVNPLP